MRLDAGCVLAERVDQLRALGQGAGGLDDRVVGDRLVEILTLAPCLLVAGVPTGTGRLRRPLVVVISLVAFRG
ncbi:hypothetical protein ACFQYP_00895 [Nonomuraea antimicrobica]